MSDLDVEQGLADRVAGAAGPRSAKSIAAAIRAKHEQGRGRKPLQLNPPRWDGDIVIECGKRVSKKTMAACAAGSSTKQAAKLIEAACSEILVRDEDGSLIPLGESGEQPVRFDPRLADAFGLPAGSPATLAVALYADDVAIIAQAQELYDWLTGKTITQIDPDELEDGLGEETAES